MWLIPILRSQEVYGREQLGHFKVSGKNELSILSIPVDWVETYNFGACSQYVARPLGRENTLSVQFAMHLITFTTTLLTTVYAARPFINEPDTGIQDFLGPDFPLGQLPKLDDLWCIHDFEFAARNFLNNTAYTWIRYGVGGEYTYRNNLEIFPRVGFRPRMLTGESNVNISMQ